MLRYFVMLALAPLVEAQSGAGIASALFPHNQTRCLAAASARNGAATICNTFSAFAGGQLAVSPASCVGNASLNTVDAERCFLISRCLAAYDVATCAGPNGFDYGALINFTACEALVAQENATLGG